MDLAEDEKKGHFNPRSPRGERLHTIFSISTSNIFQSTLPVRGATLVLLEQIRTIDISIHAPREGSDFVLDAPAIAGNHHFNPRSP